MSNPSEAAWKCTRERIQVSASIQRTARKEKCWGASFIVLWLWKARSVVLQCISHLVRTWGILTSHVTLVGHLPSSFLSFLFFLLWELAAYLAPSAHTPHFLLQNLNLSPADGQDKAMWPPGFDFQRRQIRKEWNEQGGSRYFRARQKSKSTDDDHYLQTSFLRLKIHNCGSFLRNDPCPSSLIFWIMVVITYRLASFSK